MIDAYDVLGLSLDADAEDVKKAYRRLSLQHHPDKVQAQATGDKWDSQDANARFNEIKAARDILQEPERRKIYDTFGLDLGEERPEMEVWTIGLGTLLSPLGIFTLKTILMRLVIWIVSFQWVGYLFILAGLVVGILYAINFSYRGFNMRSEEAMPILVNAGIVVGIVVICWVWQLLGESVGIFYLVSEVVDVRLLFENWKVGVGVGFGSLFVAWLVRGWWFWIIVAEVVIAVVVLISLTVACGIMGLWIESVKTQHGDKLKEHRLRMRKQRKSFQDEIAELKRKLQGPA